MEIGTWLKTQRELADITRTEVAEKLGYPGGAIKNIEEGRRIPKGLTVVKYLHTLGVGRTYYTNRGPMGMYHRFNKPQKAYESLLVK